MVLVLVLVWSGLLVQVCWSVPLSSVDNNPCPLWITTPVLCGTATPVLCGTATLVLCGQQPLSSMDNNLCPVDNNPCPLWDTPPSVIIFSFNWLVWSIGQILGCVLVVLGQGCEATIWVMWFVWQPSIPPPLMN
jgi:hypothetical protein